MKKTLFASIVFLAFTSCAKQEIPTPATGESSQVTVSFVAEPNNEQTRAFF